jgi:hypothetical protein
MHGDHHVAVVDEVNKRVSVFDVDGTFVRHVGVGALGDPYGVACSAFDELVVADKCLNECCVLVFNDTDEVLMAFGCARFTGVALFGSTLYAWCEDWEEDRHYYVFS